MQVSADSAWMYQTQPLCLFLQKNNTHHRLSSDASNAAGVIASHSHRLLRGAFGSMLLFQVALGRLLRLQVSLRSVNSDHELAPWQDRISDRVSLSGRIDCIRRSN